jgi:prepilin-type N-terminal cleavage/methylation domain-containing protein
MKHLRNIARRNQGFSLVEIAVVLVIIAILATAIGVPLASQLDQQRTLDTQKQLEVAREALYGFAMANGRLPCPAIGTSAGRESFCLAASGTCVSTTDVQSHGRCAAGATPPIPPVSGFLPAVTLGLSPVDSSGYFVDAWGLTANRVRYAVSKVTYTESDYTGAPPAGCPATLTHPLTKTDGIKGATMSCLAGTHELVNLLTVKSTTVSDSPHGCTPINFTVKAPFVVFSVGRNAGTTGGTGADEAQNVTPTTITFVSHPPTPSGNCAGEFDDIVTWGSLNTLFSRMVQAGKLP